MNYLEKLIGDIETQSVEGIRECFQNGIDPNAYFRNRPLLYEVTSEYPRGPKFKDCIRAFVDYGLDFEDQALLAVLLDDADSLINQLQKDKSLITKKYSLDCAFTPIFDATLLHICAEFNHLSCARMLVEHGADVNARAGVDNFGFGGHTPIFHTVNQHALVCIDVLKFLISKSADPLFAIRGLIWGKGYDWETFIPAVNPISYAMMGLLPQFHRKDKEVYEIISILIKSAFGIEYSAPNLPNKYLKA